MKGRVPDHEIMVTTVGPLRVARGCRFCSFTVSRRRGGGGRGQGMREGNRQRGEVIRHVKAEHPEEYERRKR